MPTRALAVSRWAGPSFGAVVLLSVVVLFSPSDGGVSAFPGSDKVVHAVLFALLAGTTRWRFGPGLPGLLAVAAYAATSEVVQSVLLADRRGDLLDVVADLFGTAVGWLLAQRRLHRPPAA